MQLEMYYYACFGSGDYSDDVNLNPITLTEEQEREVWRTTLDGDCVSEIDFIKELIEDLYDELYDIEKENYEYDDDEEEMDLSLTIGVKDIDFFDLEEEDYIHIFDICMKAKDYDLILRIINDCDELEDESVIKYYATNLAQALVEMQ